MAKDESVYTQMIKFGSMTKENLEDIQRIVTRELSRMTEVEND